MIFPYGMVKGFYFDKPNDSGGGGSTVVEEHEDDELDNVSSPAQSALNSLIGKAGDANKVALQLLEENYRYRQQLRDLRKSQVKPGQVVISEDEKALLDQYKVLGEPKVIEQSVNELSTLRRTELIREVAEVTKFKASVLGKLLTDREKVEVRKETVEGKEVPYAMVIVDGKETRLDDYAKSTWAEFLPSLAQDPASEQGSRDSQSQVTFPRQVRGESTGVKDVVAQRLSMKDAARAKVKNPLIQQ